MRASSSSARSIFPRISEDEMRAADRMTLNRLPNIADWEPGIRFTDILRELAQPVTIHRKAWEYAVCIEGCERLGAVRPETSALSVGAGTEPILYYFANRIGRVVATDLYENPDHEGKPAMLERPASFSPFPYREDVLEVYRMAADKLEFRENTFDLAFCLSSIEHFGSRDTQRNAFSEMIRVVKPRGHICIITELILTDHQHSEYFTWEEIEKIFLTDPRVKLVGGDPDLRITDSMMDYPVDLQASNINRSPHITLRQGRMIWTSFSMFFVVE